MEMTLQEAWADFIFGLHQSGKWDTLSRSKRQYFDKTNREVKSGALPVRKVKALFNTYAPGVYEFKNVFFTKSINE